jgi:hypothetical protein
LKLEKKKEELSKLTAEIEKLKLNSQTQEKNLEIYKTKVREEKEILKKTHENELKNLHQQILESLKTESKRKIKLLNSPLF